MKPYIDEKISDTEWIREFNPEVNESEEYIWHRDLKDRKIIVLEGHGWKFQCDNELPFNININDKFIIPRMIYHRLIPGKSKLRIKINEKF